LATLVKLVNLPLSTDLPEVCKILDQAPNYRIIECLGLEGTGKDDLVQPHCHE